MAQITMVDAFLHGLNRKGKGKDGLRSKNVCYEFV